MSNQDRWLELFKEADVGFVFAGVDAVECSHRIERELAEVDSFYLERIGQALQPPLSHAVFEQFDKLRPLIQTFAAPITTEMRAMVFCVLDGARVSEIQFEYVFMQDLKLRVTLEYGEYGAIVFRSTDALDVEILRHFGIMKVSGLPVIDGYYSLRKRTD
ncbi:MAG: hypothetical protein HY791_14195 [Deltaproteobacteria bacterium]|nr:hypothetical protein [Deltaproteobacteria bacterium]